MELSQNIWNLSSVNTNEIFIWLQFLPLHLCRWISDTFIVCQLLHPHSKQASFTIVFTSQRWLARMQNKLRSVLCPQSMKLINFLQKVQTSSHDSSSKRPMAVNISSRFLISNSLRPHTAILLSCWNDKNQLYFQLLLVSGQLRYFFASSVLAGA